MASERRDVGATKDLAREEDSPGTQNDPTSAVPSEEAALAAANEAAGEDPCAAEVASTSNEGAPSPEASTIDQPWDKGVDDEPWEKVAEGYEREAKALADDKAAVPLWYEAGLIHEERLGRPRPAAMCFQAAFKIDPTWRPNIRAARRLFTEVGNWAMVAHLLQAEADVTEPELEKADLLFERAVLLHERLDRSADAAALLARVETLVPRRLPVLKYLEGLAARSHDHRRLAEVCEREAKIADASPVRVALLCVAGGLFAGRLSDTPRAVDCYQQALELDPNHPVVLSALDLLLVSTGDHETRLKILETQARQAVSPGEAAAAWLEAARVAEETLGRGGDTIGYLEEALVQAPDDPTVLSELARRYEAAGTVEPLTDVLLRLAGVTQDGRALGEIHLKLGQLFEELDRSEDAVSAYRSALEARPEDPAPLASLGKLYFRAERWEDLIWTFEQEMAGSADPKQKASRSFKIAEILEQRLSRAEEAIARLRSILDETPGYLPAVQALTRLYENDSRWEDMISLLESEATQTEDTDQRISLLERVARVREERLTDLPAAAETWERILSISPNYMPAVRSLARLYRKLERWPELVRALEQEAEKVDDQRQVIAILHQVAELQDERIRDREAAIAAFRKVLSLQPNYLPALKALGRLCEQTQRWQELVDMFRKEIEVTRSLEHVVSLLMKVGEIYERRLADEDKAVATYREILEEKPDAVAALRALERLHARRGEWEPVVEILRKQADVLDSPVEKALLLTRAASIIESTTKDPEKSALVYRAALDVLPNHAPALRALTRIHAAEGAWRALADTLFGILERAKDAPSTDLRRRLGLLYMERLEDPGSARACFQAVLESAPGDAVSLAALDLLHTEAGEHDEAAGVRSALAECAGSKETSAALLQSVALAHEHLTTGAPPSEILWARIYDLTPEDPAAARRIELVARRARDQAKLKLVYQRQLETAQGDDVKLALAMRTGELATDLGQDAETAESSFRKALEISPDHLPAIRGLKRVLSSVGRWEEVQTLLEREGEASRDPERAVSLLFEAGVLREEQMKDFAAAERNYQKVLERDPCEQRAYARLCRIMEDQERYKELAQIHTWRAGIVQDEKERTAAWLSVARMYAGQLDNPQTALAAVEEALRAQPGQRDALELGASLALGLGAFEKAAVFCQQRVELGGEPASLLPYRLRLAMLHHEHLGAPERAVAWLQDVLAVDQKNIDALRRLSDIHSGAGNWAGATSALGQLVEAIADAPSRVPVLLELASVQADRRNDPAAAISTLEYVRVLDPANFGAIERLGVLHERAEDWAAVARTYTDFLEVIPSELKDEAFSLHLRVAQLQAGPLAKSTGAIKSYREAIELRPDELAPRIALADILTADSSFALQAIEEHRAVLARDPFRVESYQALYKLFEAAKAFDKTFVISAILHFLKVASEEQSFFYGDNKARAPAAPEGSLSAEDISFMLRHPDDSGPLAEVLGAMGNQLSRVFPPDLDRLQVGRSERLTPKDGSPLRKMCDSLAANLGGLDFELYRADRVPTALESFAADPPVLVVGPEFIRRNSVKDQRFLLARHISRMCLGTTLAVQLEASDFAAAVQATVQVVSPEYTGLSEKVDNDLSRRCGKSMSRKARKALEEPARKLALAGDRVDPARLRSGVLCTSDRAGLLLAGDVDSSLTLLAAEAGKKGTTDPTGELRGVSSVEDALRFFCSESFFNLRKRLKLAL